MMTIQLQLPPKNPQLLPHIVSNPPLGFYIPYYASPLGGVTVIVIQIFIPYSTGKELIDLYEETRFTIPAQNALKRAKNTLQNRERACTGYLLCEIAAEEASVGAVILLRHGICVEELRAQLEQMLGESEEREFEEEHISHFTAKAMKLAASCGCPAGTVHLLYVLLQSSGCAAVLLLQTCGAGVYTLEEECKAELAALEGIFWTEIACGTFCEGASGLYDRSYRNGAGRKA